VDAEELKQLYGDEYPAAALVEGNRWPLSRETPFSRIYDSTDHKRSHVVSRFMDGSATITLSQLKREWPRWTQEERTDFCQACCWLHEQSDFSDMLRFIMEVGGPQDWSAVALPVSSNLPQREAYEILLRALQNLDIGRTSNVAQAIAQTKHPEAETRLRKHLQSIWAHKSLWDDDKFINWVAFDATTGIAHLIEIGASPADFEGQARQLSRHVCSGNRNSCRNFLSKHYSWLR